MMIVLIVKMHALITFKCTREFLYQKSYEEWMDGFKSKEASSPVNSFISRVFWWKTRENSPRTRNVFVFSRALFNTESRKRNVEERLRKNHPWPEPVERGSKDHEHAKSLPPVASLVQAVQQKAREIICVSGGPRTSWINQTIQQYNNRFIRISSVYRLFNYHINHVEFLNIGGLS